MTTQAPDGSGQERIGVYVCHCGSNIAGMVDVVEVAEWAAQRLKTRGVVIARDYKFMCSSLGQELIEKRHSGVGPDARRGGRLFPSSARADLSHGLRTRRSKPLPV